MNAERVPIISRFASAVRDVPNHLLSKVSCDETVRILGPVSFEKTEIYFLDLSTGSPTGTFKDHLASVTVAHCLHAGIESFVTQTSGNTGNAIARYAHREGIEVHIFYPARNRYKILPELGSLKNIHFVEVEGTERDQKLFARRYAQHLNVPWLPNFQLQIEANKLRAYFLEEWCRQTDIVFDWKVQALSSGFGIFGFYRGLAELGSNHNPAFLGVQQQGRSPYAGDPFESEEALLEPTLFRSEPGPELLSEMKELCRRTSGRVVSLSKETYDAYRSVVVELFGRVGLQPRPAVKRQGFQEKSPLIALAGAISQIKTGGIREGQSLLVAVTGGCGAVPSAEFQSSHWVDPQESELVLQKRAAVDRASKSR